MPLKSRNKIKEVLPNYLWEVLRKIKNKATQITTKVKRELSQKCKAAGERSRFWAKVYYTFFSSAFEREFQAVLSGQTEYKRISRSGTEDLSLLRRNVHRIEKGLIMKPRRDTFALDYIKETIEVYVRVVNHINQKTEESIEVKEAVWAQDVLRTYFEEVTYHPIIEDAHHEYQSVSLGNGLVDNESERATRSGRRAPYYRDGDSKGTLPDYEQMLSLSIQRRSVRWFKDKQVPREKINKALQVARQSPSACNRQPFEFRVYDDPELVEKISKLPGGTTGYAENIPVIIVIVGHLQAYFSERDRHLIYIDGSLAAMSFMLALETIGLSSCPINWPDVEEREEKMDKAINLSPYERPVMLLAAGYPDDDESKVAYSQKKDVSKIISYNKV